MLSGFFRYSCFLIPEYESQGFGETLQIVWVDNGIGAQIGCQDLKTVAM